MKVGGQLDANHTKKKQQMNGLALRNHKLLRRTCAFRAALLRDSEDEVNTMVAKAKSMVRRLIKSDCG